MTGYIRLIKDTVFKASDAQSSELDPSLKQAMPSGNKLDISAYVIEGNHVKFTIANRLDDIKGRNTWYCFLPHCEVSFNGRIVWDGDEKHLTDDTEEDKPSVSAISNVGSALSLPGYSSPFYLGNSIYPGSNFTWAEATKNGTRVPPTKQIVDNIISQAKCLDQFREHLGNKPLTVTSWYRDPITNKIVGGARNSDHLTGRSTDIFCPSMNIYDFQKICLSYWRHGGVGRGAPLGFVHLSSDNWYRVWDYT
jgi:hypothetical protein